MKTRDSENSRKDGIMKGLFLMFMAVGMVGGAQAVEVPLGKMARIGGARDNHLVGLGLVTGLGRTGDSGRVSAKTEAEVNMFKRFGVEVPTRNMKSRDTALVMVTATLPPFARSGDRIDVTVSAAGDARSLQGGILVETPLQGADGKIYALVQGALAVGGFAVEEEDYIFRKNLTTVGRIPGGAIVEASVPVTLEEEGHVSVYLKKPSFVTASRVAREVNRIFDGELAVARDGGLITVRIPFDYKDYLVEFIAALQEIPVHPASNSNRVVVNERTGTLVIGQDVRIDSVAVSHGDLRVEISRDTSVKRSAVFGTSELETETTVTTKIEEQGGELLILPVGATLVELVDALNSVGATPRDMISILQAIKRAGALHAELEVI